MTTSILAPPEYTLTPEQEAYTRSIAAIFDLPVPMPVVIDASALGGDVHEARELAAELAAFREMVLVGLARIADAERERDAARATVVTLRDELRRFTARSVSGILP